LALGQIELLVVAGGVVMRFGSTGVGKASSAGWSGVAPGAWNMPFASGWQPSVLHCGTGPRLTTFGRV
jgi:hypothetical protein